MYCIKSEIQSQILSIFNVLLYLPKFVHITVITVSCKNSDDAQSASGPSSCFVQLKINTSKVHRFDRIMLPLHPMQWPR